MGSKEYLTRSLFVFHDIATAIHISRRIQHRVPDHSIQAYLHDFALPAISHLQAFTNRGIMIQESQMM
jgi:hypothetical protein